MVVGLNLNRVLVVEPKAGVLVVAVLAVLAVVLAAVPGFCPNAAMLKPVKAVPDPAG